MLLTVTQKKYLQLMRRGHFLEVEKRAPGFTSQYSGAEIGGRGIKFDTARRMIDQNLVEKLSEDGCTVRYGISLTAIQILGSLTEARR